MRLSLYLAAALSSLLMMTTTPAAAADKLYEGTAGNIRIVMAIDDSTADVAAHYFYESTRLDIEAQGQRQGDTLSLASDITGDKITLTPSGNGLVGTLVTAKGRRLPVSLHPAAPPRDLPADLPSDLEPYQKIQLSGLKLVSQQVATIGGRRIHWYREGLSGQRLFRLESGYAPIAMLAVNHALARQQWQAVADWLGCTDLDGKPGIESSHTDAPWLSAHVVSYTASSSWYCAHAAHPDFGTEGHGFDMATGRELTLDDVLRFGAARPPAPDSDPWFAYRDKVFGPSLTALLGRYHPREMARPKDADDCDYRDAEVWKFPAWSLTAKGLWVGAGFARVERRCDNPDWAIIPWARLAVRP